MLVNSCNYKEIQARGRTADFKTWSFILLIFIRIAKLGLSLIGRGKKKRIYFSSPFRV